MKIKDRNKIEKNVNYDLKEINPVCPRQVAVKDDYLDQKDGIVRIMRAPYQSEDEFKTIQEQHNANHALYYFSMITDGSIRGRCTGDNGEKIRRIREHMMNLREYIGDDKAALRDVINTLLKRLEEFHPRNRKQFALFIYENWTLIWAFARTYGHHERCFSKKLYQRLEDVVSEKYYLKLWWWKMKTEKFLSRMKKFVKRVKA